jgi:hypothetical protein
LDKNKIPDNKTFGRHKDEWNAQVEENNLLDY